jgi:hypothetical protein
MPCMMSLVDYPPAGRPDHSADRWGELRPRGLATALSRFLATGRPTRSPSRPHLFGSARARSRSPAALHCPRQPQASISYSRTLIVAVMRVPIRPSAIHLRRCLALSAVLRVWGRRSSTGSSGSRRPESSGEPGSAWPPPAPQMRRCTSPGTARRRPWPGRSARR